MTNAKDLNQASQWCQTARELLKSSKSKAVKAAREQLKLAEKKLAEQLQAIFELNPNLHREFRQKYLELAGRINDAVKPNARVDEGVVAAIGKELGGLSEGLAASIKTEKALAEELGRFRTKYAEYERKVAAAAGLNGARMPGGAVSRALEAAAQHMKEAWLKRGEAFVEHSPSALDEAKLMFAAVDNDLKDAKEASKLAAKEAEADLKAGPEWSRLRPLAQRALESVRGLAGAEEEIKALEDLVNGAVGTLVNQDGVWRGYKAAIAKLQGYEALAERARQAHQAYSNKGLPKEVVDARALADKACEAYKELAPPYAARSMAEEIDAAAERGRDDRLKDKAVLALTTLTKRLGDETTRLKKERGDAEAAELKLATLIESLTDAGAPPMLYQAAANRGKAVKAQDMANSQWASATQNYTAAVTGLERIKRDFDRQGADWKRKGERLVQMKELAQQCLGMPALTRMAQTLLDGCAEVRPFFDRYDIAGSIKAYDEAVLFITVNAKTEKKGLEFTHDELQRRVTAGNFPVGEQNKDARERLVDLLKQGARMVSSVAIECENRLRVYVDNAQGVSPRYLAQLKQALFDQVGTRKDAWFAGREQLGGDPAEVLRSVDAAVKAMRKIVDDQLAVKGPALTEQVRKLVRERAEARNRAAPEQMAKSLEALSKLGIDVSAERDLVDAQKDAPIKSYRDIWISLQKKEERYYADFAEARRKLKGEVTTEIDRELVDLPISKVYKEELVQQSTDIKQLVDTEDPDLLEIAQKKKDALKKQFEEIAKDPKRYQKNKSDLAALAKRIGELVDDLPETTRRLQTRWAEEDIESRHCTPAAMSKRLAAFTLEVERGEAERVQRKKDVEVYRKLKTEVRAAFDEMKKTTATRLTDKAKAFEAWYEARIEDAKAAKGRQGGIPEAMRILGELKTKLDGINSHRNPEMRLRELDAQQTQDVITMKDLARQWELDVAFFLEDTLAKAKEEVKRKDGEKALITGLEDLVSAAGKLVKPYTAALTLIGYGEVEGPDLAKVKADFAQARQMLGNAQRSAARLTEAPQTTNVQGPTKDGLRKLAIKWGERTHAYAETLNRVGGLMRASAKGEDPQVVDNAGKAADMVEALVPLFRADAFAASFGVLTTDPETLADDQRQALARRQLAAREDALRQMREFRRDTAHPLLRKLCDAQLNPFEPVGVTVAVSGIATALKEIELQALASA
ncbi:MAG: hypothetical protein JO224_12620 [Pelomonas sp.]|nr:hypothetical protein [Roseateles sp.]